MKTVIFISQRTYPDYDFAAFKDNHDMRLVAVLMPKYYEAFPEQVKPYFDKLYCAASSKEKHALASLQLDYEASKTVVADEIAKAGGPEHVVLINTDDFNSMLTGRLRDEFGIKGASLSELKRYHNKTLMKSILAQHNIRVPRFQALDLKQALCAPEPYYQALIRDIGPALVIKPCQNAGSINTYIIRSREDFLAFARSPQPHDNDYYEVEEFIEGTLHHCDSIVQNQQTLFTVTSRYLHPNHTFLQGKAIVSMPLLANDVLQQRIEAFNQKVLNALGYLDGTTHMEVFVTHDGEIVFLEIQARTPGIKLVQAYEKMYELNMTNLNLAIQVGEAVKINKKAPSTYVMTALVPTHPGVVTKLNEPPLSSKYDIDWAIKVGDQFDDYPETFFSFASTFFAYNENYEALSKDFLALQDYRAF